MNYMSFVTFFFHSVWIWEIQFLKEVIRFLNFRCFSPAAAFCIVHPVMFVNTCCLASFQLLIPSHVYFPVSLLGAGLGPRAGPVGMWDGEEALCLSYLPLRVELNLDRETLLLEASPRCTLDLASWLSSKNEPAVKLQCKFRDLASVHLPKLFHVYIGLIISCYFGRPLIYLRLIFGICILSKSYCVCFNFSRADLLVRIALS